MAEGVKRRASAQQFVLSHTEGVCSACVCRAAGSEEFLQGSSGQEASNAGPLPPIPAQSEDEVNINFRTQDCVKQGGRSLA